MLSKDLVIIQPLRVLLSQILLLFPRELSRSNITLYLSVPPPSAPQTVFHLLNQPKSGNFICGQVLPVEHETFFSTLLCPLEPVEDLKAKSKLCLLLALPQRVLPGVLSQVDGPSKT